MLSSQQQNTSCNQTISVEKPVTAADIRQLTMQTDQQAWWKLKHYADKAKLK